MYRSPRNKAAAILYPRTAFFLQAVTMLLVVEKLFAWRLDSGFACQKAALSGLCHWKHLLTCPVAVESKLRCISIKSTALKYREDREGWQIFHHPCTSAEPVSKYTVHTCVRAAPLLKALGSQYYGKKKVSQKNCLMCEQFCSRDVSTWERIKISAMAIDASPRASDSTWNPEHSVSALLGRLLSSTFALQQGQC